MSNTTAPVTLSEAVLIKEFVEVLVRNWESEDPILLEIAERLVTEKTSTTALSAARYIATQTRFADGTFFDGRI